MNRVFYELGIEVGPRPHVGGKRSRGAGGSGRGKRRKIESTFTKTVVQPSVVLEAAKAKLRTSSLESQKKKEKVGQSSSSAAAKPSKEVPAKTATSATVPEVEAAGVLAGPKVKKSGKKSRFSRAVKDDEVVGLDPDLSVAPEVNPEAKIAKILSEADTAKIVPEASKTQDAPEVRDPQKVTKAKAAASPL